MKDFLLPLQLLLKNDIILCLEGQFYSSLWNLCHNKKFSIGASVLGICHDILPSCHYRAHLGQMKQELGCRVLPITSQSHSVDSHQSVFILACAYLSVLYHSSSPVTVYKCIWPPYIYKYILYSHLWYMLGIAVYWSP